MKINTNSKKLLLALLLAYGGVLWLNVWHQIGHSYGTIGSSPVVYWLRDSVIVLLPALLAVFLGTGLSQWLGNRSNGRLSPRAQNFLSVVFVSGLSALAFVLIESNPSLRTGIGNDFALEVSICRTINSTSFQMVDSLLRNFSDFQVARFYVMLKDGVSLFAVAMGITVLMILTLSEMEKLFEAKPARATAHASMKNIRMLPSAVVLFSMIIALGGIVWLTLFNAASSANWLQSAGMTCPWLFLLWLWRCVFRVCCLIVTATLFLNYWKARSLSRLWL